MFRFLVVNLSRFLSPGVCIGIIYLSSLKHIHTCMQLASAVAFADWIADQVVTMFRPDCRVIDRLIQSLLCFLACTSRVICSMLIGFPCRRRYCTILMSMTFPTFPASCRRGVCVYMCVGFTCACACMSLSCQNNVSPTSYNWPMHVH